MKVLFAVNNDKISEAVIKKYPKDYKELLSYKNVYYFNAILKEIQNDKSYDRIVISEDLEPFVNTNHDSIDNFLFNHLDKISDEAQGNDGKEISIILICSERRTFGSNILSKLFSIGIYNALIGNDRSMDNLCRLINRPRTKKEAKLYYRIDQATYESAVDNGEVSETEIQNILNHFKKLGKSTDRYTDSFNNIAGQYTDDQLKLIINVLPMKVKAVLEAESDKYQSLMGTSSDERRNVAPVEPGIRVNTIGSGKDTNVSGPIVIPSGVKRFTGNARPVVPNNVQAAPARPVQQVRPEQKVERIPEIPEGSVPQKPQQPEQSQIRQTMQVTPKESILQSNNNPGRVIPKNIAQRPNPVAQDPVVNHTVNRPPVVPRTFPDRPEKDASGLIRTFPDAPGAVKPKPIVPESEEEKEPVVDIEEPIETSIDDVFVEEPDTQEVEVNEPQEAKVNSGKKYTGTIAQVKRTLIARRKVNPAPVEPVMPEVEQPEISPLEPEVEEIEEVEDVAAEEPRRGRGRPRKPVSEEELNKPKGKRGRPRKNMPEEESSNLDDLLGGIGAESSVLPGLEDSEENSILPGLEEEESVLPGLEDEEAESVLPGLDETEEDVLPGLEEEEVSDEVVMPGLEDEEEAADEDLGTIPGLDDLEESEDNGVLPGLEDEEADGDAVDVNSLLADLDEDSDSGNELPGLEEDESALPGLEEDEDLGTIPGLEDSEEASDDGMLPGMDEESEEAVIPGLDDEPEYDDSIPGLDEETEYDDTIPGLDEEQEDDGAIPGLDEEQEDDGAIPGLDEEQEYDDSIPGLDEEDEDLGAIPGLEDNDDEYDQESNAIESIKPQIDYSMSSLNSLLSKDKKIVAFVGATKNGTSFLINNLALMFSMMGIDVAILDMTQNKNSYYLFTDSREELRKIAYTSLSKLENGYADGIKFNKNLTVYTGLPSDGAVYENAEPILSTLVQNHSLILIDTDFTTPPAYFASSQEIYLVQSMDILTIQPLTAFLRDLKFKGAWEPEKARVVINKEVPIRILSNKTIIGGMSRYNGPDMSVMTDLFNKDMVKACSIPFDEKVYAKYLETLATCKLSIGSLPKQFRAKLQILGEMVYPRLNSKTSYSPTPDVGGMDYNGNNFSNDTNSTLNKMKKKF